MLAYVLALIVGLGSFALYMAAFFFPEMHRKYDLLWSGVGLFYGLVLWVCAGRITGGVLLGQMAGVALLGWLGWQTLWLRRQAAPLDQQTPMPTSAEWQAAWETLASPAGRSQVVSQVSKTLVQIKDGVAGAIARRGKAQTATITLSADEDYVPPKLEEFGTAGQEAIAQLKNSGATEPAYALPAVDVPLERDELLDAAAIAATQPEAALSGNPVAPAPEAGEATGPGAIAAQSPRVPQVKSGTPTGPGATFPQTVMTVVAAVTETMKALVPGRTQKQPNKSVYVRKEFRDKAGPEAGVAASTEAKPATKPYVRKAFRENVVSGSEAGVAASTEAKPATKPYVRKAFREKVTAGPEAGVPAPTAAKPGSKPVYVRKAFRDPVPGAASPAEATSGSQTGRKPYVRKAFRDQDAAAGQPVTAMDDIEVPFEPIEPSALKGATSVSESMVTTPLDAASQPVENGPDAIAPLHHLGTTGETQGGEPALETLTEPESALLSAVGDAAGESGQKAVENVGEPVENVSETIAPDLLGHAPPDITAEAIVEELLEAISAQEAADDQEPDCRG